MRLVELTMQDFEDFAQNHPLRNYCQSTKYAKVMGEKGYSYDYIGYKDDSNNLIAASLVLIKKIGPFHKFAYAPKGFLIDYYNSEILKLFIKDFCAHYKKRGVVFIKINPEIIIGELLASNGFMPNYNQNVSIIDTLKDLNFKRRREIFPLDFIMPRISAYIDLKKFDPQKLSDDYKNKIKSFNKKGFSFLNYESKEINVLYNIIKPHSYETINYFRNILNIFNNNESELFLIKMDHQLALVNAQKRYQKEMNDNSYWNEMIQRDNSEKNLKEKMESDKRLLAYKEEMVVATENLKRVESEFIGGALVVKYKNRVSIIACGFKDDTQFLSPESYLYYSLIERYRNDFDFLDLNGLASNFNSDSKYYNYNKDKLAFNPTIYEFIGEFDLVLNENSFKKIQSKGLLSKEFYPSYKLENIESEKEVQ